VVGLEVWKVAAAAVWEAAAGNAVAWEAAACGDDSCDDNIPRMLHNQRSHRKRSWLDRRLLSLKIRGP
jgi:hypothetical protein